MPIKVKILVICFVTFFVYVRGWAGFYSYSYLLWTSIRQMFFTKILCLFLTYPVKRWPHQSSNQRIPRQGPQSQGKWRLQNPKSKRTPADESFSYLCSNTSELLIIKPLWQTLYSLDIWKRPNIWPSQMFDSTTIKKLFQPTATVQNYLCKSRI